MKRSDIIAVIVLGEIVAVFLSFIFKSLELGIVPLWTLFFILPVLALIAVYVSYLIGKKFLIVFQFAKYATVGFANTAVDFGTLNLLMWLTHIYSGKTIFLLNTISFLVAVIHSYIWNKLWTFKAGGKNITSQFLQFVVVSLVGALINGAIVYTISTLVSPMFGLADVIWANAAKAIATGVALVWNFLGYKFVVFRRKESQKITIAKP